jgi:hypothetical protein
MFSLRHSKIAKEACIARLEVPLTPAGKNRIVASLENELIELSEPLFYLVNLT